MKYTGTIFTGTHIMVMDTIIKPHHHALYDERGLLSMAFHPNFANNGRFFIFYNAPLGEGDPEEFDSLACVSEFQVSKNDSDRADPESEIVLLQVLKPQLNHNGGQLAFGPGH